MFTECRIRWIDDGSEYDVIIRADDTVDPETDDRIFFYGLSRERLLDFCRDGTVCENEWQVVSVGNTYDSIY